MLLMWDGRTTNKRRTREDRATQPMDCWKAEFRKMFVAWIFGIMALSNEVHTSTGGDKSAIDSLLTRFISFNRWKYSVNKISLLLSLLSRPPRVAGG